MTPTERVPGQDPTFDRGRGGDPAAATMPVADAQADVRRVYRAGSVGQLVSAAVWAAAAATATLGAEAAAPLVLFLGGMLIFPIVTLVLRALGGPAALPRGHPMAGLAFQTAIQVPCGLLVALVLAQVAPTLFFPAAMVVVGAHYAPFVFLYGSRSFAALAAVLVAAGVAIALLAPAAGVVGGWLTAVALAAFGVIVAVRGRRR